MSKKDKLLKEALTLKPKEKAGMIDELIKSLDIPDEVLDDLWKKESESRIEAYDKGHLNSISVNEAFGKYKNSK